MAERFLLYPTSTAAGPKSLVVWDMDSRKQLGNLEGHNAHVNIVAARGSLAVSCQDIGPARARVWNLETMQCSTVLPIAENDTGTYSACCMEDRVILGQKDGIIKLWDVAASAPIALADLEGHASMVFSIKAGAAGSMVLSGSSDQTVRLWDLRTGGRCVRTMEGHTRFVLSVDMDGHCRTAVSASRDSEVKLWDLGTGLCTEVYNDPSAGSIVRDVVMHESGSSFLSSGHDSGFVNAWAVGSTRAIMRANMEDACVPNAKFNRLLASTGLSTVTFCSFSTSQIRLSVWR